MTQEESVLYQKRYREENKERINAKRRENYDKEKRKAVYEKAKAEGKPQEYYQKDKEKWKAASKKYYQGHKEKYCENSRSYYQNHKEIAAARSREWYEQNKEKVREYYREYVEKNKKTLAQKRLNYFKKNPHLYGRYRYKRKLREKAFQIPYTDKEMFRRWGYVCGVCGGPIDEKDFHRDHVIPLSKGGHDTIENVRPCHPACNLSKNAKLLEELDPLKRTPLFSAHVERLSEKIAEK